MAALVVERNHVLSDLHSRHLARSARSYYNHPQNRDRHLTANSPP